MQPSWSLPVDVIHAAGQISETLVLFRLCGAFLIQLFDVNMMLVWLLGKEIWNLLQFQKLESDEKYWKYQRIMFRELLSASCCRLLYSQVTHQWLFLLYAWYGTYCVCVFVCIFVYLCLALISTIGFDNYCNKYIPSELVHNEFSDCVCVCLTELGFGLLPKHWGKWEWRRHSCTSHSSLHKEHLKCRSTGMCAFSVTLFGPRGI